MPENIEFQQVVVDRVVIKMCGDCRSRHIVCRMLYQGKSIDLLSHRKYNDTSRMLSGRSADADTSLYDTVDLTVSLVDTALLVIILDITECRFIGKCTDRTGTEGLSLTENNLTVRMRFTLVLTGEVQVDIRLLISLESKECLKRDIKSVLD